MAKILLVARRELGAFFNTWTGYIVIFAALLLDGLLFNIFALGEGNKYSSDILRDFFFFSSGIGMVAGIFMAIHLLAEEKQRGTLLLYFTSPISERQVIYGKFLASAVLFLILNVLSLYLPALIFLEGKVSLGHMASGYLGLFLLGSTVLSLSLFASSLASNQLLAGIGAALFVVIAMLLWVLAAKTDQPFRDLFLYASIHNERFRPFSTGVIHTRDIAYYLSVIVFFLECSVKVLETRRAQG